MIKEGVVVERAAPVFVDISQLGNIWSLPILEGVVNILLSHYKVAAELVKVLEAVLSEELLYDRVPNGVAEFELGQLWKALWAL